MIDWSCFRGGPIRRELFVKPLIITAAITGAETTKAQNPNLPVTPKEQAADAAECVRKGASVIHLHVRDKAENASQSLDDFRASIGAIRTKCPKNTIVQISTGGAVGAPMEGRIAPIVELKPEMASLNVGSLNFGDDIFMNHPVDVRKLAGHMRDLKVIPEVEVYEVGHISIAQKLFKAGLLSKPIHYQFVMGVPGGIPGELEHLFYMKSSISSDDTWAVAGIGRFELPLAVMAIVSGGHVRVGFEDNVFYSKGVLAKSNAELVARIRRIAEECGRPVATPEIARELLGIK